MKRYLGLLMLMTGALMLLPACAGNKALKKEVRYKMLVATDYRSKLHAPSNWRTINLHDEASIQAGNTSREEYLIVLTEKISDLDGMDLASFASLTANGIVENLSGGEIFSAREIPVNGNKAIQYRIRGEMDGLDLVYIHTSVEGETHFHQVISWTLGKMYNKNKLEMERAIRSFSTLNGPSKHSTAQKFIAASGLKNDFDLMPAIIEGNFEEIKSQAKKKDFGKVLKLLKSSFSPKRMNAAAVAHISSSCDPAKVGQLVKMLKTSLLKKMVQAENKASTPAEQKASETYAANLDLDDPQIGGRLELIRRLDDAVNMTESTIDIVSSFIDITVRTSIALLPDGKKADESTINRRIAEMQAYYEVNMPEKVTKELFYTYREISDEDLAKYIEFLESDLGRYYSDITNSAIQFVVDDGAKRFGEGLAKTL